MANADLFCDGQLSLFDLVEKMSSCLPLSASVREPENYLVRGEKILSLLKKETKTQFQESSFLELFSQKTFEKSTDRGDYVRKRIKQALIRPVIEGCNAFDGQAEADFRALFCGFDNFSLEKADPYGSMVYRAVARDEESWVICMFLDGEKYPYTFGKARVSYRKQRQAWHMKRVEGGDVRVMDFGDFFADMVFLCQAKAYLDSYFAELEDDQLAENVVYHRLCALAEKEIGELCRFSNGTIPVWGKLIESSFLNRTVQAAGYRLVPAERRGEARLDFRNLLANFLLSNEVTREDLQIYGSMNAIPLYGSDMADILGVLLDDYSEEKRAEEYRRNLSETYAKSFMTKKNIPQKMVDAMEASGFNSVFGYVEFDEECDIAKLDELYAEFEALSEFLHLKEHKQVALRFRKLGNHKASGLYYPSVRCLCVDVRSPSSFSHELFHMLDYEHGELSRKWEFQKCKDLYKEEFNRLVKERGTVFKGKYDREYYFQSTEIFARCAEMYLTRICGIDNSLVKPEESVAYPWTDSLAEEVKNYFDSFLFGNEPDC